MIHLFRDTWSMTDLTCEGRIPAMDAICINAALSWSDQMYHTVMDSIEQSFPVERTTLKYDSGLKHGKENLYVMP